MHCSLGGVNIFGVETSITAGLKESLEFGVDHMVSSSNSVSRTVSNQFQITSKTPPRHTTYIHKIEYKMAYYECVLWTPDLPKSYYKNLICQFKYALVSNSQDFQTTRRRIPKSDWRKLKRRENLDEVLTTNPFTLIKDDGSFIKTQGFTIRKSTLESPLECNLETPNLKNL